MACIPGWLFFCCGLFLFQLRTTLCETYVLKVTGNCSGVAFKGIYYKPFRVWSTQKRNDPFHCIQYTTDCSEASMPDHLNDSTNFMGKPQSLHARAYLRPLQAPSYPGINITWTPPLHAAGIGSLKGFLVRIYPVVGTGKDVCRIFDFSQNHFTAADVRLTFNKEIYSVKGGDAVYLVTVFTLPCPKQGERMELSKFQFVQPQPIKRAGTVLHPADWVAPLTFDNATLGVVRVEFGMAPPQLGFTKYRLELIKHDARNVYKEKIITQADLRDPSWASWKFTRVPQGLWRIRVQPVDRYFNDGNRCLCYDGYSDLPGTNRSCVQCLMTESSEMFVGDATQSTSSTTHTLEPIPDSTTPLEISSTTEVMKEVPTGGTSDTGKIVGSVLGSIAGAVLLMIIGLVVWKRSKRHDEQIFEEHNHNNNNDPFYENHGIFTIDTDVSRKTVLLVSADDHTYHNKVVEQFAIYLETFCKCDVIYAPWCVNEIRALGNGNLWTITNIDRSDYTIIINSEAAFYLFEAWKNQGLTTTYKNPDASPEGDLFTPAIMHIMSKLADSFPKFIMTSFEYTDDQYIISEINLGHKYKLPKHMSNLLSNIHRLDTKDMMSNLKQTDLPYRDYIADTEEGKNLDDAIRLTIEYEKRNPMWFKDQYIRMDSGFHSTGPDELQFGTDYDCVSETVANDANSAITYIPQPPSENRHTVYTHEVNEDDLFEPPESIRHFDRLSLTLSDQMREVNTFTDTASGHLYFPDGFCTPDEFVPPDCESLGGMSV